MSETKYDIYFRGEILPGADEPQVKAAIAKIFKADEAKIAQLFSGKINTIKKSVDKVTAGKYQQAFKKAGAKALITVAKSVESIVLPTDHTNDLESQSASAVARASSKSDKEQQNWDVLPPGSDLLKPDERRNVPDAEIDTSNIKLVSPFFEVEVRKASEPSAPDTSHISVAEAGEDMNPDRIESVPELKLDLSQFSVAEPGVMLADKQDKKVPAPPDTNHIKLV